MSKEELKLLMTVAKIVRAELMLQKQELRRSPGFADNDLLALNKAIAAAEDTPND
jgi:hypothetical protein